MGWSKRLTTNKNYRDQKQKHLCTWLVTTAAINTKAIGIENKIPDVTNPATRAALNTKARVIESGIPDITILATKVVLNTKTTKIGNKIPDKTGLIATLEFTRVAKISCENERARIKPGNQNSSNRHHLLIS